VAWLSTCIQKVQPELEEAGITGVVSHISFVIKQETTWHWESIAKWQQTGAFVRSAGPVCFHGVTHLSNPVKLWLLQVQWCKLLWCQAHSIPVPSSSHAKTTHTTSDPKTQLETVAKQFCCCNLFFGDSHLLSKVLLQKQLAQEMVLSWLYSN